MKKLIIISLVLGMSGCIGTEIDEVRVSQIRNVGDGCEVTVGDNTSTIFFIHNCPCDKYKIGDNPFKCK